MLYIGFNPIEITAWDFVQDLERCGSQQISAQEAVRLLSLGYVSFCNRNHKPVLDIVKRRYGIDVEIPMTPFLRKLRKGDKVIIIVVANIRHLEQEERYTEEELRKSRIFFRLYRVR